MNATTAQLLCELNSEFYQNNAATFATSRQSYWPGWQRCLDIMAADCSAHFDSFTVCDLACGNLRFEAFLYEALPQTIIDCYAVDNCPQLSTGTNSAFTPSKLPNFKLSFQELDIIGLLVDGQDVDAHLQAPPCACCVSFGFMHHIPGASRREAFLQSLVQQTRPGGYTVVSLWQFLNDIGLKAKAEVTREQALLEPRLAALDQSQLEPGDYFIGWNKAPGQYRYCHNFSDTDIDRLTASIAKKATVAARFQSDGRGGNLNTYLLLKVPQ